MGQLDPNLLVPLAVMASLGTAFIADRQRRGGEARPRHGMLGRMDVIDIGHGVRIPVDELELSFARSGGPGGQHVNTSATKVELRFDVASSPSLTDVQRERIASALGSRMTSDGVLVLQSSEHRSQTRNREAAIGRFAALLSGALRPSRPRRPTRPTRASRRRRLEDKRRRSERKSLRRKPELP